VASPAPKNRRRAKAFAAALTLTLLAPLALAQTASAGIFLPESDGSPNAAGIKTLYILIAVLGLIIFIGVEGLLIYSMVKFKARKGATAAQIHGNTQLEIGWTVGAAVILIFITAFTFIKLGGIKDPAKSQIDANGQPVASLSSPGSNLYASTDMPAPPKGSPSMNIQVIGQQYIWQFFYPGAEKTYSYETMYVPVGMTITLDVKSVDVAHSWWIPALGGKADAIPGYVNKTWFQIPLSALKPGQKQVVYNGNCAELCGRNHANMLGTVVGLRYADWKAWYAKQTADLKAAKVAAAAQRKALNASEGQ
jgi:cytochrome c oxidase subunit II